MKKLVLVLAFALAGCGGKSWLSMIGIGAEAIPSQPAQGAELTKPNQLEDRLKKEIVRPKIDKRLLEPCDPLTGLPEGATRDDVIAAHGKNVVIHRVCSERNAAQTQLIKEAFPEEEKK